MATSTPPPCPDHESKVLAANLQPSTDPRAGNLHSSANAEWDMCIRKALLTIGSGMLTAVAVGTMVAGADTLLLVGTGAGVLWSVKRCRALMRDGILSPEEAIAMDAKRKSEREERKRQQRMEKEARQKEAADRKDREKQKRWSEKKKKTSECCEKLKRILEAKGINVEFECELFGGVYPEKPTFITRKPEVAQVNHPQTSQGKRSPKERIPKIINHPEEQANSLSIQQVQNTTDDRQKANSAENNEKLKLRYSGSGEEPFSTVKLFAPGKMYLSTSMAPKCNIDDCTCKQTDSCTCDQINQLTNESQEWTIIATDSVDDSEDKTSSRGRADDTSVQQDVTTVENVQDLEYKAAETGASEESPQETRGTASEKDPMEKTEELTNECCEECAEDDDNDDNEVQVLLSTEDQIEIIFGGSGGGIDITVQDQKENVGLTEEVKNDSGDQTVEQLTLSGPEVEETCKPESWPFSFSLPSLDKFSKKKNTSFKWPPLTSSIIAKPKREMASSNCNHTRANQETKQSQFCACQSKPCKCSTTKR